MGAKLFKLIKKIISFFLALVILLGIGKMFVLPRVLPLRYQAEVEKYSALYNIEPSLAYAVIFCESSYNPNAQSHAGAYGLMQVTQETGWWATSWIDFLEADTLDLSNPEENIAIGCWYLGWLLERYQNIQPTALAAYNAGHGTVGRWLANTEYSADGYHLDKIPYPETDNYVIKVTIVQKLYQLFYGL